MWSEFFPPGATLVVWLLSIISFVLFGVCVAELSTPHRIAKVEGVAGVVIVVQLEGPPRFVERVLPAGRDFGGLVFNGGWCETPT